MQDLSLHILDVAENSVRAGARTVDIRVEEDSRRDLLTLEVRDDGRGMDEETRRNALDPFFSTRTTRSIGLGLPLLREAARAAGGSMTLDSLPGRGTRVRAEFRLGHIDRKPLGDIVQTLVTLIIGNPGTDFVYRQSLDGRSFSLATRELRDRLGDGGLDGPDVVRFIRETLQEGLESIRRKK
ncbi:MAG: ATP-binding protein [Candidatus Aminicenantes bacterium]|nr:ATP-binding protein [Candidatus Aminicenantes bacterium]